MDNCNIRKKVIRLIRKAGYFVAVNEPDIHLFHDISMDSFAFIRLLVGIEKAFGIEFDITQMEECAKLDRLLELIGQKAGDIDCD